MSYQIEHLPDITAQELAETVAVLYAAFYYTNGKSDYQFAAIDKGAIALQRARKAGMKVPCEAKDPEPPKPNLPLFDAFAV